MSERVPGQALLSGRLLAEGTVRRDWRRISEEAEARGCFVAASAGYTVQALVIDGLAVDLEAMLEWAAELLWEPAFPRDRSDWLRQQAMAELESLSDHPEVVAERGFRAQMYPDHPLGRPLLGTAAGLAQLEPDDCRSFHQECLDRGLYVAIAGAIDPEEVEGRLEALLRHGDRIEESAKEPTEPMPSREALQRIELTSGQQAHLLVGARTVRRSDPDFESLAVLGVALGSGGLVGRIPARIRERDGLAYACDVATVLGAGLERGRLQVALATSADTVESALEAVLEELRRVRDDGLTSAEVEEARAYLVGREPFRRETARQRAVLGVESMLLGVPVDDEAWCRSRVENVSQERVLAVARKYLDPSKLVVTIASPS